MSILKELLNIIQRCKISNKKWKKIRYRKNKICINQLSHQIEKVVLDHKKFFAFIKHINIEII